MSVVKISFFYREKLKINFILLLPTRPFHNSIVSKLDGGPTACVILKHLSLVKGSVGMFGCFGSVGWLRFKQRSCMHRRLTSESDLVLTHKDNRFPTNPFTILEPQNPWINSAIKFVDRRILRGSKTLKGSVGLGAGKYVNKCRPAINSFKLTRVVRRQTVEDQGDLLEALAINPG